MAAEHLNDPMKASSYETGELQQKQQGATILQLPSLTSKPTKQRAPTDSTSAANTGGYQPSLVQKSKVILPTALWILFIVIGVSFITLLASLNKAVDTLDKMVEAERERGELMHHHQQNHLMADNKATLKHFKEPSLNQKHDPTDSFFISEHAPTDMLDSELMPTKTLPTSWFTFPSWASLEPLPPVNPPHHGMPEAHYPRHPSPPLENIVDDIMRQMMSHSDEHPQEVSGSIIISEHPESSAPSHKAAPSSLLDGFMSSLKNSFGEPSSEASNSFSHHPKAHDKFVDGSPSLFSAKIDNLNINVDAGEQSEASTLLPPTHAPRPHYQMNRDDEIRLLEDSIDTLATRLIEQKTATQPHLVEGPFFTDQIRPVITEVNGHLPTNHHHQLNHHTQEESNGPLSPLSGLLLPFGFPSHNPHSDNMDLPPTSFNLNSLFDGPEKRKRPQNHQSPFDNVDTPIIVSIASDENSPHIGVIEEFRAPNKGPSGNFHSDAFNGINHSPYELTLNDDNPNLSRLTNPFKDFELTVIEQPNQSEQKHHPKHSNQEQKPISQEDAKWNILANDLADSLLHQALETPTSSEAPQASIVMMDGIPLNLSGSSELASDMNQQSSSIINAEDETSASKFKSPMDAFSNIFGAFLGPIQRHGPKLFGQESTTSAPQASTIEKLFKDLDMQSQTQSTNSTPLPSPSSMSNSSTLTQTSVPSVQPTTNGLESSSMPADKNEAILNELVNNMFTSPQFGSANQQQQQTSSTNNNLPFSTTSTASGSGSSTPTLAGGSSNSTARESMICDCQKLPSNSTARRNSPSSSTGIGSRPPVQGGRNANTTIASQSGDRLRGGSGGTNSTSNSGRDQSPRQAVDATKTSKALTTSATITTAATPTLKINPVKQMASPPQTETVVRTTTFATPVSNFEFSKTKNDSLPNDPLLKDFIGVKRNESLFLKEETTLPVTPISATILNLTTLANSPLMQSSKPNGELLTNTGISTAASSSTDRIESTTSSTTGPLNASQNIKSPVIELVRKDEALGNLSVIDLGPYVKSSVHSDEISKLNWSNATTLSTPTDKETLNTTDVSSKFSHTTIQQASTRSNSSQMAANSKLDNSKKPLMPVKTFLESVLSRIF